MDFTLKTFKSLLDVLKKQDFAFQTFAEFIEKPANKVIVLRQDVDRSPENSLGFARIQAERGIRGTYYFRVASGSFDEKIIKEIYSLGHEIGYHYENLGVTAQRHNGVKAEENLVDIAIEDFKANLLKLRESVPVKTICMHGSPLSRWDSRLLWKYYDYHDFGIIGEPYFDVDFDEVLYLTDTGRRWDGDSVNVRDKSFGWKDIETKRHRDDEINKPPSVIPAPHTPHPVPEFRFHSTFDIIRSAEEGRLPNRIMMTFHPQRWTDKPVPLVRELVWQNVKNAGKYFLVKMRGNGTKVQRYKGTTVQRYDGVTA